MCCTGAAWVSHLVRCANWLSPYQPQFWKAEQMLHNKIHGVLADMDDMDRGQTFSICVPCQDRASNTLSTTSKCVSTIYSSSSSWGCACIIMAALGGWAWVSPYYTYSPSNTGWRVKSLLQLICLSEAAGPSLSLANTRLLGCLCWWTEIWWADEAQMFAYMHNYKCYKYGY